MNGWMKNIPDETILSEINMPGSHDSATRFCQLSYFARCQRSSVFEQLCAGVRLLDLRVERVGDRLSLVHAVSKCFKSDNGKDLLMLEDVLEECRCFLMANPTETLVISIKCDHGDTSENTFDVLYKNYLTYDFWYLENRIPQLYEVRGRAVFFNRFTVDCENEEYNDLNTGLNFSGWLDQGRYTGKTHLTSVMLRRDEKESEPVFIQDWYKLPPKRKWRNAVLPTLNNAPCRYGVFISFLSCGNVLHNPERSAKYINKRFLKAELSAGRKYGWLMFDFVTEKLCRKVILTNF